MEVNTVRVRFASKIPGPVQYSSVEWEGEIVGTADAGDTPEAMLDTLTDMMRARAKAHLLGGKDEQRVATGAVRPG